MPSSWIQFFILSLYIVASLAFLSAPPRQNWRLPGLALLNIATIWGMFYRDQSWIFLGHFLWVLFHFVVAKFIFNRGHNRNWLVLFPILFLVGLRLVGFPSFQSWAYFLGADTVLGLARFGIFASDSWIGVSYLAFRMSLLGIEIVSSQVAFPSLAQFISSFFFPITLTVGPITPYRFFQERFQKGVVLGRKQIGVALERILIGTTKYFFLGAIFYQGTFSRSFSEGQELTVGGFLFSVVSYTLYLYVNFSGFCDVVIGTSGLLGIQISENFNSPLIARNLRDYWQRWHISLSEFLRDSLFTPVTKWLIANFPQLGLSHAVPISTFLVFVSIGLWHGFTWNFLLFGCLHGVGVIVFHYYQLFAKRWPAPFRSRYDKSLLVSVLARALTFSYVAICLFVFENSWTRIQQIWRALQGI